MVTYATKPNIRIHWAHTLDDREKQLNMLWSASYSIALMVVCLFRIPRISYTQIEYTVWNVKFFFFSYSDVSSNKQTKNGNLTCALWKKVEQTIYTYSLHYV